MRTVHTSIFLLFILLMCSASMVGCTLENIDATDASVNASTPTVTSTPVPDYRVLARQDAIDAGIPVNYFINQIAIASNFDPNAIGPDGEIGIAQWLPSTASGLGINPHNPVQSLQGAAQMMGRYYQTYGKDYAKALAAYNTGSGTINGAIAGCGGLWERCIPPSTVRYIHAVMG